MSGANDDAKGAAATAARTLVADDVVFGEGPRWHDGAFWFSDIGAGVVRRVAATGHVSNIASPAECPTAVSLNLANCIAAIREIERNYRGPSLGKPLRIGTAEASRGARYNRYPAGQISLGHHHSPSHWRTAPLPRGHRRSGG